MHCIIVTRATKLIPWHAMFESALPTTLKLAPNTDDGFENTVMRAPDMIASIAERLSPSKRICMLSISAKHIQGHPQKMVPTRALAQGRIEGVAPASEQIASMKILPDSATIVPTVSEHPNPVEASIPACSFSSVLRWRDIALPIRCAK